MVEASHDLSIHEVDFCSQIASAVNILVQQDSKFIPVHEARVEGFGAGAGRRNRKDLRFYDNHGKLILCGEVKLPGTPEGRSPYDAKFCEDAEKKAGNAGVRFFFTWNVNSFVLWDRSLWDRTLLERRVREWPLGRNLRNPGDVAKEDNLSFIKTNFLPLLLHDVADIISERRKDWYFPPDDIFIRSLESHLDWPVQLLSSYILDQADKSRAFASRVEQWMTEQDWVFVRAPREDWIRAVDNMAKTLAYVWTNRLIFYKALLAKFTDLPRLELRPSIKEPEDAVAFFNRLFQLAVDRSGDYEPLLFPETKDWATALVFHPPGALEAWRGLLRGIGPIDFREVSSDVVGRIFQKLIGPEERHRYGQHFTGDDVVDLINVFCVHDAGDNVLDPACGSGSFLVRAYYRKRRINPTRAHAVLISELFGCDIALYPAHLATLNLAAREISDEANYPRISRRDFFDFFPEKPFCYIPDGAGGQEGIELPPLDAIVGNPPYVRQEKIDKKDKEEYGQLVGQAWPDLRLSGRSDLHCYFWPAATRLLREDGYFGFLTSSSWLDVEYGFLLQGWLLRHFRILAIMESSAEPWFEDARVKTCVTILQRCEDPVQRMSNKVRFVRFIRQLADIIGIAPGLDEEARQAAYERLRRRVLEAEQDYQDQDIRIIIKSQKDLWEDGVYAATIVGDRGEFEFSDVSEEEESPKEELRKSGIGAVSQKSAGFPGLYRAGKWGRYLRAPDFYFEIMRRFGDRFVALGEVANIRRGITSGCDAFFMPKDVTEKILKEHQSDRTFRQHTGGALRRDAESGKLKIIEAGDGSIHPIEAKYLAPELHSPMEIDRPVVRAADLDRVVLLVGEPMGKLKHDSPWVWRYLNYGSQQTFASTKSKAVPVPKRSTCAARDPWYDLTGLVRPGIAFWPMAQQYRHIIPNNPERLVCNHRLFDISPRDLNSFESNAIVAILNSTLVGLWKNFYGRYTGTEGSLDTEVIDVKFVELPNPICISEQLARRYPDALKRIIKREVGRLVEEQLMNCHDPERARRIAAGPLFLSEELQQADRRALDDAVFELLGVGDAKERASLIDRLYEATAQHFREIRVVEIEKMEQRAKSDRRRLSVDELAADIWDAADFDDTVPLKEWLAQQPESDIEISIPEERPAFLPANPLFELKTVSYGKEGRIKKEYDSRAQAELVYRLANLGIRGNVRLGKAKGSCQELLNRVEDRMEKGRSRFKDLAESRTSDEGVQVQLMEVLERWYVLGKPAKPTAPPKT